MKRIAFLAVALLILVALAGCYSRQPSQTPEQQPGAARPKTEASTAAITIENFAFSPQTAVVKKGTKVTWTNKDDTSHRIQADDDSFIGPDQGKGATYNKTFDEAGTFPYKCGIHPYMTGKVVVK